MARARDAFRTPHAVVAITVTPLLLTPVAAQEYCVACTGPDAVYRCVIEQANSTGMPLKMLCISTLARDGAHGTCAIRQGTVFDCNGPIRRIDDLASNIFQSIGEGSTISHSSCLRVFVVNFRRSRTTGATSRRLIYPAARHVGQAFAGEYFPVFHGRLVEGIDAE